MDFTNRSSHAPTARTEASAGTGSTKGKGSWKGIPTWLRVIWIILLFSGTILVVAIVALLYFGNPKESKYIQQDNLQAVFLTNGQVYFGDISTVNDKYLTLNNIYYLSVEQQVQPKEGNQSNNISLVKLGCELHGPMDQMIINREQVTFWENLKSDGQVAKAVQQWLQQNPNGQQCAAPSTTNQ